jgi:membrane-bound lytic murein transglycosylase D
MKHSAIICSFLALATFLQAQDSTLLVSTTIVADSSVTTPLPLDCTSADSLPLNCELPIYFDEALAYLDTTECTSDTIIAELPDSIYKQRLQALPFIIEVPYNEVVRRYILRYVKHSPRQLASLQRKAQYYFPIFEDILAKHQLPFELCYLPVIESALNPQAHSPVGAAGLWQFMPATGKKYGLEINSLIDERMDPIRSTEAACQFLKALYNVFGDWNLVIAAYNCGPGNVNKAIKRANKGTDYWAIYNYLPRETRGYVPAFIAVNYAMEYATEVYNICPSESKMPVLVDTVMVSDRMHFEQIAANMPITVEQLRKLNPQYKLDIIPAHKKPCAIVFPVNDTLDFIAAKDSILEYEKEKYAKRMETAVVLQTTYKIRSGDDLWDIAKKKGTTVAAIRKANPNKNLNVLRIGQVINLPVR